MIVDTEGGSAADERARRVRLSDLAAGGEVCRRCPQLVAARTQVVFGEGDPGAALMFVGEAPGAREDAQGVPLAGRAGRLLDELLEAIGLRREQVYVTTLLKCHPPGNRDPAPAELERCRPYLHEQVALIRPRVVCTLGEFATQLVRGAPGSIRSVHGRAELATIGTRAVRLLPLYHPAAALYGRPLLEALRADVAQLPALLALAEPAQPPAGPQPGDPADRAGEALADAGAVIRAQADEERRRGRGAADDDPPPQLGLF